MNDLSEEFEIIDTSMRPKDNKVQNTLAYSIMPMNQASEPLEYVNSHFELVQNSDIDV